jgi:stearoyl-CoA desaturase (Delta-9 desaturase)
MTTILIAVAVFLVAYTINMFTISVLYHRGLTHGAVTLHPWLYRMVGKYGSLLTGIDPKAWICMHRMHHEYSDTAQDPHSPWRYGVFGVIWGQLVSYERTLVGLKNNRPKYTSVVSDIQFDVSALNRNGFWLLPYALHIFIGIAVGALSGSYWIGLGYYLGMTSHPIQGWLVNAFGHHSGYRNYQVADKSTNNAAVALLCFGEGYQNNHHARPSSAKFSVRWFEFDAGYVLCRVASGLGLLKIVKEKPAAVNAASTLFLKQNQESLHRSV